MYLARVNRPCCLTARKRRGKPYSQLKNGRLPRNMARRRSTQCDSVLPVQPAVSVEVLVHLVEMTGARLLVDSHVCTWYIAAGYCTTARVKMECDGTRAETRFGLPAKRTSPFISAGVSVQSAAGS